MKIQILGPGCHNCVNLERVTHDAVSSLGIDATIEKVTDYGEIAAFGIMRTPGLVIDGEVVVAGRVPAETEVRDLLSARST